MSSRLPIYIYSGFILYIPHKNEINYMSYIVFKNSKKL